MWLYIWLNRSIRKGGINDTFLLRTRKTQFFCRQFPVCHMNVWMNNIQCLASNDIAFHFRHFNQTWLTRSQTFPHRTIVHCVRQVHFNQPEWRQYCFSPQSRLHHLPLTRAWLRSLCKFISWSTRGGLRIYTIRVLHTRLWIRPLPSSLLCYQTLLASSLHTASVDAGQNHYSRNIHHSSSSAESCVWPAKRVQHLKWVCEFSLVGGIRTATQATVSVMMQREETAFWSIIYFYLMNAFAFA